MIRILKVGLIGSGARGYYTSFWTKNNKQSEIVALAEPNTENANRFLKELDRNIFVTKDYKELLKIEEIDAVIITSPDYLHEEQAIDALHANKHVFLDKPMAITIEGSDNIMDVLSQTDRKLMIGFNMRYMTLYQTMKKVIDEGKIGEVKAIWVRHFVGRGGRFYYQDWHRNSKYTNSLLLQKGSHDLDMIHMLGGSYAKKVSAFGSLDFYNNEANFEADGLEHQTEVEMDVEDNSVVIMELENGIKASYLQNHFTPDYQRNYTIIGTKGRLESDDINNTITITTRAGKDIENATNMVLEIKDEEAIYHDGSDFKIWDSFVDYVNHSIEPAVSVMDGRMSIATAVKATESSREGGDLKEIPKESIIR